MLLAYAAPAGAAILPELPGAGADLLGAWGRVMGGGFTLPRAAAPYADAIRAAENRYAVLPGLLARVLYQESHFRPDIVSGAERSPVGAIGIAQFMPATAAELGVDPFDPYSSIDGAARYLRNLFDRFGSWQLALAAYNWGQGNVARRGLGEAPAETRDYIAAIAADVPGVV